MKERVAVYANWKAKGRGMQCRAESEQHKRGDASSGQYMLIALNQGENNAYNRMETLRAACS